MKKIHLILIGAIWLTTIQNPAFSQNRAKLPPEQLLEAKKHYLDAAQLYASSGKPEDQVRAGMNYYRAGRRIEAMKFLRASDSLGLLKTAEARFAYFDCLRSAKRYAQANRFASEKSKEYSSDALLTLNANQDAFYSKATTYTASALTAKAVNTEFSEFGPAVYGGLLYFTSSRPDESNKKIHRLNMQPFYNLHATPVEDLSGQAFKPQGAFGVAEVQQTFNGKTYSSLPAGLNKKYHDGPLFVSSNGQHLFFTTNWHSGRMTPSNERVRLNIYYSEKKGSIWSNAVSLPFNGKNWSTQHACFDERTSILYFSSDRPGGFGGFDLWSARLENGKWSDPENLGKQVNTPGNEVFPSLSLDGGLLFSSDGWPGLGGLDVFLSDDPDRSSINLLGGVNSEADDFGMLFLSKENGVMVSNRAGTKGDDDLWAFRANLNDIRAEHGVAAPLAVKISYGSVKPPASANVEVQSKESTTLTEFTTGQAESMVTASEGSEVTVRASGFEPTSTQVSKQKLSSGELVFSLSSMAADAKSGTETSAFGSAGDNIDFENRSFIGLQGSLNGGRATIDNTGDTDYHASLSDGQSLNSQNSVGLEGLYAMQARASSTDARQSLNMAIGSDGKPALTLTVDPQGGTSEGWQLTSGDKVLAKGSNSTAKNGEWYDAVVDVRRDSIITRIGGKVVSAIANPGVNGQAGTFAVASSGSSQFDDLRFTSASPASRVAPGEIALFAPNEQVVSLADAIRNGAVQSIGSPLDANSTTNVQPSSGTTTAVTMNTNATTGATLSNAPDGTAFAKDLTDWQLAAGLEQIRREQPEYVAAYNATNGIQVSPVIGNAGSNEEGPLFYQNRLYVRTDQPIKGQTQSGISGSDGTQLQRLVTFGSNGKPIAATGVFSSAANGGASDPSATGDLPAGLGDGYYPGAVSVSSQGNRMVIADGAGHLMMSIKSGNTWSTPVIIPISESAENPARSLTNASGTEGTKTKGHQSGYFDEATSTLYFSSDRAGGYGGLDIWKSTYSNGQWSEPVNLGPSVNSAKDEVTPFLTSDGHVLFSSNGWQGLGNQDVFAWKPGMIAPVNLLQGVNSKGDDVGVYVGQKGSGYISSNRAGGKGKYDVYRFGGDVPSLVRKSSSIKGISGKSVSTAIPAGTVVGDLEGSGINRDQLVLEIDDSEQADLKDFYRIVGGRLVTIRPVPYDKGGLRTVKIVGRDKKGNRIRRVVEVWPAPVKAIAGSNESVGMKDKSLVLYFRFGRLAFRRKSVGDAERLAKALASDQTMQLNITVHSDCVGSDQVNQRISDKRAKWLVRFFEQRAPGSSARIRAIGYGESSPAVSCSCEPGGTETPCKRAQNDLNRRAEVSISVGN